MPPQAQEARAVTMTNPELDAQLTPVPSVPQPPMSDIVMINNRECKPVHLHNGDIVFFIAKAKGREYRILKRISTSSLNVEISTRKSESGQNVADNHVDMDLGNYYDGIIAAFPFLAIEIKRSNGEIIPPTMDYFDNLDLDDADLVANHLETMTNLQSQPSETDPAKKK